MSDIKRKAEVFLCAMLRTALPGQKFLPANGGDETAEAEIVAVPYTVVTTVDAKDLVPGESTWLLTMVVTYVTHLDDTRPAEHSAAVRTVMDALRGVQRGQYPAHQMIVHGVDIDGTGEVEDAEKQSHGDITTVSMGCSG